MPNPLGMVKDGNLNNPDQVDVYALVLNNLVVNTILASYNEILSISASYDYSVDTTMQGTQAGIGWSYNGSTDVFTGPPPAVINWPQNVEFDFDNIILSLQQCVSDCGSQGGNLSSDQIITAYNSSLNDNPNLDQATLNIMSNILSYVQSGG